MNFGKNLNEDDEMDEDNEMYEDDGMLNVIFGLEEKRKEKKKVKWCV